MKSADSWAKDIAELFTSPMDDPEDLENAIKQAMAEAATAERQRVIEEMLNKIEEYIKESGENRMPTYIPSFVLGGMFKELAQPQTKGEGDV